MPVEGSKPEVAQKPSPPGPSLLKEISTFSLFMYVVYGWRNWELLIMTANTSPLSQHCRALLSSPLQIVTNTPPATKAFVGLLLGFSIAHGYLQFTSEHPQIAVPYLTVVPGRSFLYPWTLLTAGFVESHFLGLLLSLLSLAPSFRYLERLWGAFETAKFIGIVITIPNFIAFLLNWIEYAALGSETFLYGMDYHGLMALQTGVLVAFTQLIPEHQLQFFGLDGSFHGLIYDSIRGLPMHYLVSILMEIVQKHSLSSTGSLPLFTDDLETGVYSSLTTTQPGGARAEAERRRALALKALDSRLANSASTSRPSNAGRSGAPSRPTGSASTAGGTSNTAAENNTPASSSNAANGTARKSVDTKG
ncbi:9885_t:CDS:2, partial [Acaulospora colombiana]